MTAEQHNFFCQLPRRAQREILQRVFGKAAYRGNRSDRSVGRILAYMRTVPHIEARFIDELTAEQTRIAKES